MATGKHPHRNHRWKVEWCNAHHYSKRLSIGEKVNRGGHLVRVLPFEKGRDATSELNHLDAALHFTLGIGNDFPVLIRNRLGDLARSGIHQFAKSKQDLVRRLGY